MISLHTWPHASVVSLTIYFSTTSDNNDDDDEENLLSWVPALVQELYVIPASASEPFSSSEHPVIMKWKYKQRGKDLYNRNLIGNHDKNPKQQDLAWFLGTTGFHSTAIITNSINNNNVCFTKSTKMQDVRCDLHGNISFPNPCQQAGIAHPMLQV